jgi:hypothetical protein
MTDVELDLAVQQFEEEVISTIESKAIDISARTQGVWLDLIMYGFKKGIGYNSKETIKEEERLFGNYKR